VSFYSPGTAAASQRIYLGRPGGLGSFYSPGTAPASERVYLGNYSPGTAPGAQRIYLGRPGGLGSYSSGAKPARAQVLNSHPTWVAQESLGALDPYSNIAQSFSTAWVGGDAAAAGIWSGFQPTSVSSFSASTWYILAGVAVLGAVAVLTLGGRS